MSRLTNLFFLAGLAVLVSIPGWAVYARLGELARQPAAPADLVSFADRFDLFVSTRLWKRGEMVKAYAELKSKFSGASKRVVAGSDGWLFLNDNDSMAQSAGERLDTVALERLVAMARQLRDESASHGRRFALIVAPNKQSIYREKLAPWARRQPRLTELDVLFGRLAAENVPAFDPRPDFLSRKARRSVYWQRDSHWTPYGAALAFNGMVRAVGEGRNAIDVDAAFGADEAVARVGDVASMQGAVDGTDVAPRLREKELLSTAPYERRVVAKVGAHEFFKLVHRRPPRDLGARPRVLMIGDSFTHSDIGPMFMRFSAEYQWIHHRAGLIDLAWLRDFDPDIVILETVERQIPFFSDELTR